MGGDTGGSMGGISRGASSGGGSMGASPGQGTSVHLTKTTKVSQRLMEGVKKQH